MTTAPQNAPKFFLIPEGGSGRDAVPLSKVEIKEIEGPQPFNIISAPKLKGEYYLSKPRRIKAPLGQIPAAPGTSLRIIKVEGGKRVGYTLTPVHHGEELADIDTSPGTIARRTLDNLIGIMGYVGGIDPDIRPSLVVISRILESETWQQINQRLGGLDRGLDTGYMGVLGHVLALCRNPPEDFKRSIRGRISALDEDTLERLEELVQKRVRFTVKFPGRAQSGRMMHEDDVRRRLGVLQSIVATPKQRQSAVYDLLEHYDIIIGFAEPERQRAIGVLIKSLGDKDRTVRGDAALILGYLKSETVLDPLMSMLGGDRSGYARKNAAFALGEIGDARAVGVLVEALDDKSFEVGDNAAFSLYLIAGGIPPASRYYDLMRRKHAGIKGTGREEAGDMFYWLTAALKRIVEN